jgi:four helix bundle protein
MSKELEDRLSTYAKRVRDFSQKLKQNVTNIEYIKQLIKASSSVGANYIEASDDLGRADEKMKIKISRREVKEAKYFLSLVMTYDDKKLEVERNSLVDESGQIQKILSAILNKLQ